MFFSKKTGHGRPALMKRPLIEDSLGLLGDEKLHPTEIGFDLIDGIQQIRTAGATRVKSELFRGKGLQEDYPIRL